MKRFLVLTMLFPALSMAQMDGASRDLLIDKLTKVNSGLAPADPSKVAVTLRLADLLADRARVSAMQDLDGSCKPCVADRAQAARLYQGVLDRVPQANRGKVMIQLGHLHQLNNEDVQARSFYEKVANESSEPNVVAEARLSVAEGRGGSPGGRRLRPDGHGTYRFS